MSNVRELRDGLGGDDAYPPGWYVQAGSFGCEHPECPEKAIPTGERVFVDKDTHFWCEKHAPPRRGRTRARTYGGPRSVCTCGHTGDGPNSQHGPRRGHSACAVPDCDCARFTWKAFLAGGVQVTTRTNMVRWVCPFDEHPGTNAPSRMRKDDLRRYCIPCSERTGRLVERVAPKLAAERAKSRAKSAERRRKKLAPKREHARARRAQERRLRWEKKHQRFRGTFTMNDVAGSFRFTRQPFVEVRPSKHPRAPRFEADATGSASFPEHIVIFDHEGADLADARGAYFVAVCALWGRWSQDKIRDEFERRWGVRPRAVDDVLRELPGACADALRRKEAAEELGRGASPFAKLRDAGAVRR